MHKEAGLNLTVWQVGASTIRREAGANKTARVAIHVQ